VPKLVIFRGDAVESETRLTGTTVCIGRDSRNDVVLDDSQKGVSRFHAEIRADGGGYVIVDLKSRNGIWVNGQRIKEKARLALGVPVTLGAYELALEDDVSTTEFGGEAPLLDQHTVVGAASVDRKDGPSRSGTRASMRSPVVAARQQVLLWSGAAVATVLSCAVAYGIVRYRRVPPPPVAPAPQVAVIQQKPVEPTPTAEDLKKAEDARKAAAIDQHLADARVQMEARDYAGAVRDHLQPVLELEPDNAQALELKRQADEAVAAAEALAKKSRITPKPETPAEVETSGIPRRANETWPEYTARVTRIKVNFQEGNRYLDKLDYANAIARFHLVERDQPRYLGVDLSISEATAKQQKALEDAMNGGQQNEAAGKLHEARQWYQRALVIDPGSTAARERNAALLNRMTADANRLMNRATFAAKSQDTELAVRLFQQIVDLMLPGDEVRDKAAKQLEELKR
jgi:pSer/pThr/pTyr-binding forkhead associated (FHA) protein/tetratricopeptide (TPR) repeat protein